MFVLDGGARNAQRCAESYMVAGAAVSGVQMFRGVREAASCALRLYSNVTSRTAQYQKRVCSHEWSNEHLVASFIERWNSSAIELDCRW